MTDAPVPGDPRDRGPRPAATARDALWLSLAVAAAAVTAAQFIGLAVALMTLDLTLSLLRILIGFTITIVWLLTISWVVLGAWRRTVWGCPFRHALDAPEPRRCRRHALVPPPTDGLARPR